MKSSTSNDTLGYILGQLSAKIDALDKKLDDYQKDNKTVLDDHEKRIRSIERIVWRMSAVAGLLGGGAVYLINYFVTGSLH